MRPEDVREAGPPSDALANPGAETGTLTG
jgi:hypothetical protein